MQSFRKLNSINKKLNITELTDRPADNDEADQNLRPMTCISPSYK